MDDALLDCGCGFRDLFLKEVSVKGDWVSLEEPRRGRTEVSN